MKRKRGTSVTFIRQSDGTLTGFTCEGHAQYGSYGNDIVCAAISALTQAALGGLKDVLEAPVMYEVDDNAGFLEVRLTPEVTQAQLRDAQIILKTLAEAIRSVEANYPNHVHIFFEERR